MKTGLCVELWGAIEFSVSGSKRILLGSALSLCADVERGFFLPAFLSLTDREVTQFFAAPMSI